MVEKEPRTTFDLLEQVAETDGKGLIIVVPIDRRRIHECVPHSLGDRFEAEIVMEGVAKFVEPRGKRLVVMAHTGQYESFDSSAPLAVRSSFLRTSLAKYVHYVG